MEDTEIINLYFARSESAITESKTKYGRYCHTIAYRILRNEEDSEECLNDTWLHAWQAMPPQRPDILSAFLGRITRNLSLNRYERENAQKRGSGEIPLLLEELTDAIPANDNTGNIAEKQVPTDVLNRFLESLSADSRILFIKRYFYMLSVSEIAKELSMGESKIKMSLLRSRKKLHSMLETEGILL